jgi:hypothetical protein
MQSKTDKRSLPHPERPAKTADRNAAYREIRFDETCPVPDSLLPLLKYDYLRQELWVPLEKREGRICVLLDDPQNILKRDAIESLLRTKTVEYCVAPKEDILLYIDHFFKAEASGKGHGNGEDPSISEADNNIVKLVDDVIDEAYQRRASDISGSTGSASSSRPSPTSTAPRSSRGSRSCPTSISPNGGFRRTGRSSTRFRTPERSNCGWRRSPRRAMWRTWSCGS